MKCLYHLDADGKCAAYWVAVAFDDWDPNNYIRMNYGWDVNWLSKVEKDETVVIVDFSIEPDEMRELLKKTQDVIWIDHHYSAIKKYDNFETEIKGLRYDGIAGCMLTYCYFFEMNEGQYEFNPEKMTEYAPEFTKYIADHDVWKFEFGDNTRHFILGFEMLGDMPPYDKENWTYISYPCHTDELIERGAIAAKYRDCVSSKYRKSSSFEYYFGNHSEYKVLCFNYMGNSAVFGEEYDNYDAVCLFSFNGKYWSYTFYSSDPERVNCADIAESYKSDPATISAGGHKGAAGLQTTKFLFTDLIK